MSEIQNIDTLRLQNAERMQELLAKGVSIDPVMILKARLDLISEILFEALNMSQDVIEGDWELLISNLLNQAEEELAQYGDTSEDTQ